MKILPFIFIPFLYKRKDGVEGEGMAEFRTWSKIMAAMSRKGIDHRSHLSTEGSRLTLRYERNSFLFYLSLPSFRREWRFEETGWNWHIDMSLSLLLLVLRQSFNFNFDCKLSYELDILWTSCNCIATDE